MDDEIKISVIKGKIRDKYVSESNDSFECVKKWVIQVDLERFKKTRIFHTYVENIIIHWYNIDKRRSWTCKNKERIITMPNNSHFSLIFILTFRSIYSKWLQSSRFWYFCQSILSERWTCHHRVTHLVMGKVVLKQNLLFPMLLLRSDPITNEKQGLLRSVFVNASLWSVVLHLLTFLWLNMKKQGLVQAILLNYQVGIKVCLIFPPIHHEDIPHCCSLTISLRYDRHIWCAIDWIISPEMVFLFRFIIIPLSYSFILLYCVTPYSISHHTNHHLISLSPYPLSFSLQLITTSVLVHPFIFVNVIFILTVRLSGWMASMMLRNIVLLMLFVLLFENKPLWIHGVLKR